MSGSLRITNVSKQFGGVHALQNFSIAVAPGEVHGLIGENGSGKSTAMKILSGELAPDSGQVVVGGQELPSLDPTARLRHGVGVVMQDPQLCNDLSVAENLWLGRQGRGGIVRWGLMRAQAEAILARTGLDIDPLAKVGSLSQDERHLLEVSRVVAWDCQVIGFDETTASLTEDFVEKLFTIMRELRDGGAAQVFISHRLNEVLSICDVITVLRDGELVGTVRSCDVTESHLISMMVGRSLSNRYDRKAGPLGKVVLEARGLQPRALRRPVNLDVRAGEVVGIGGLVGSGRSEVLESIYGAIPRAGTVKVNGRTVSPGSPRFAIKAGMGLVPEDRRTRGLAMEQSVKDNATMVMDGSNRLWSRVDQSEQMLLMSMLYDTMKLKSGSDLVPVRTLSGGNQQKIVLGRWLRHRPAVLLLDEPTRGIDVGAKREIYALIEKVAEEGMAVVLVSSELPELTGLCDRILMMREGEVVGQFPRGTSHLELMTAAAGKKSNYTNTELKQETRT